MARLAYERDLEAERLAGAWVCVSLLCGACSTCLPAAGLLVERQVRRRSSGSNQSAKPLCPLPVVCCEPPITLQYLPLCLPAATLLTKALRAGATAGAAIHYGTPPPPPPPPPTHTHTHHPPTHPPTHPSLPAAAVLVKRQEQEEWQEKVNAVSSGDLPHYIQARLGG